MTDRQPFGGMPGHVLVMLGASTAGYALLLAGVAGLQSRSDAVHIAVNAPAVGGVAEIVTGHDSLTARLDAARATYAATVEAYMAAGGSLEALDGQMARLAGLVAEIDGVSRTLPSSVKMPAVKRSVSSVKVPSTSGTTGASGK